MKQIVVITGMCGAGKHLAARSFEDFGWRVIDNLPPRLLSTLVFSDSENPATESTPLCLVCDVRGGEIESLLPALNHLKAQGANPVLLFLDATDSTLVQRYKETRRTHPLFAQCEGILPAIDAERDLLGTVKESADMVIDTTDLAVADLRQQLQENFADPEQRRQPIIVTVASFGFKHGLPLDADLVFDVRFLNNPYYVEDLRFYDGRNPEVERYVMADERTISFLDRLYDLVGWSLPQYVCEGKAYLVIAVGCTGGRHRSVVVAEKLSCFLTERGYRVITQHRDIGRVKAVTSVPPLSSTPSGLPLSGEMR